MGSLRDEFGHICTETRRESFYIHDLGCPGEDVKHECPESDVVYIFPRDEDPEVAYEVLDDLIAALVDVRDNDKRYRDWKEAQQR